MPARVVGGVPIPDEAYTLLGNAYSPCPGYATTCGALRIRFEPAAGHVPRGFVGGYLGAESVRLIVVGAEPGDPYPGENHAGDGTPPAQLESSLSVTAACHRNGPDAFHRNMRHLLELCWPGLSVEDQLSVTWITDSVLCSAPEEGGNVRRPVWRECRDRFLKKQLDIFPHALVMALGGKAAERLADIIEGRQWIQASAVAPPGANKPSARESWRLAADRFRQFMAPELRLLELAIDACLAYPPDKIVERRAALRAFERELPAPTYFAAIDYAIAGKYDVEPVPEALMRIAIAQRRRARTLVRRW